MSFSSLPDTSENGEGAYILELADTLPHVFESEDPRTFVEFGAWDGVRFSNCAILALSGWSGVFIESNAKKVAHARQNYQSFDNIVVVCKEVGFSQADNLDSILKQYATEEFLAPTVLSIDVDGEDLELFLASGVRPQILLIEFNALIQDDVLITNPRGAHLGSSKSAIILYLSQLGYELRRTFKTNLVFSKSEDRAENYPTNGFRESQFMEFIEYPEGFFFGYDGTLYGFERNGFQEASISPNFRVPWSSFIHGQPIHPLLRGYREGIQWPQLVVSALSSLGRTGIRFTISLTMRLRRLWMVKKMEEEEKTSRWFSQRNKIIMNRQKH